VRYIMMSLCVRKRSGKLEPVQADKVSNRIEFLRKGVLKDGTVIGEPLNGVSSFKVAKDVIGLIENDISTTRLDEEAALFCANLVIEDPEYGILGGRIAASNHQKNTLPSFATTMKLLYENRDSWGNPKPLLNHGFYKFVTQNASRLDAIIDQRRDYRFDYFGFQTLKGDPTKQGYFLRRQDTPKNGLQIIETPQHMYLRVAVALNLLETEMTKELESRIRETYDMLSLGKISCASPTMFNAGTNVQQLASCFLLGIGDNMTEPGGIADCFRACCHISKMAGGIGIGIGDIRARGTPIAGMGGRSDGIVPMAKTFNSISVYVGQGGRRPGAIKLTIPPWHADLYDFLDLRKPIGKDEVRARDIFYALWVPDLFMKRLRDALPTRENTKGNKIMWSFMCPHECPGLTDVYGEEFENLYQSYESQGRYRSQDDIVKVWRAIVDTQKETGGPDILFSDSINRKNNQKNLGTIKNSNLCSEIVEYSSPTEYAVCNLASISLVEFVKNKMQGEKGYDYRSLHDCCKIAIRNLNTVIDINHYPLPECRASNLKHRPIALGIQGFADALLAMGLGFEITVVDSEDKPVMENGRPKREMNEETRLFNRKVSEVMYYACLEASMELAREREEDMIALKKMDVEFTEDGLSTLKSDGLIKKLCPIRQELERDSHLGSYSSFLGSPASEGQLAWHMWGAEPHQENGHNWLDWDTLILNIKKHGLRNSLVRANMPTASTAQILGNSECIEPYKYAIYTRRVTAGDFVVANPYLHRDLKEMGLFTNDFKRELVKHRGSVQSCHMLPREIRDRYLTVYEINTKTLQILSAERSCFIDQTESFNIYEPSPTTNRLLNIFVGAWQRGLKTGMYYLRREPIQFPIQFTVGKGLHVGKKDKVKEGDCTSCTA
jgi:ribonucleotide reductase alpha subunit